MFWFFFFPNTLFKKGLPPPCAASRTGPLRVVAGRARLTLGISSRSVQSAALTLRTRRFGDVVQRGRHPHAFLRRSLRGRSCFPPRYKPGSPGSPAQWTRPPKNLRRQELQSSTAEGKVLPGRALAAPNT